MRDIRAKVSCNHKVGEVTFTLAGCPRCKSTGYYFDLEVGPSGDVTMIEGSSRLLQDIEKVLVEQAGTNVDDSQWGSELYKSISVRDVSLTKAHVVTSVINALKRLKDIINEEDASYGLPSREKIANKGISDLRIVEDTSEPRRLNLQVTIISESRKEEIIVTPLSI